MSGPNPPEPGSGDDELDSQPSLEHAGEAPNHIDDASDTYSQAYSAPESEQFVGGPYVPIDPVLYDYDSYTAPAEPDGETGYPRWPWVVGVVAIIAAIALVASVALLVARSETRDVATPETTTSTAPPVQDEITTTTRPSPLPPPPPPPPSSEEPPPPPTETPEPVPPPVEPPPEPTTTEPPVTTTTTTAPAGPRQVTYSVTGTKAPFDQITITYIDASGQRRTQRNAYIPWSITLTPISQSEVGSVEASSLLRLSKLNCSITSNDGTVLSSNSSDAPQTSC
jgi:hypothetical protein